MCSEYIRWLTRARCFRFNTHITHRTRTIMLEPRRETTFMKGMFTRTDGDLFVFVEIIETNHTTLRGEEREGRSRARWCQKVIQEATYGILHFASCVLIFTVAFVLQCVSSQAERDWSSRLNQLHWTADWLTARDNSKSTDSSKVSSARCRRWVMTHCSVSLLNCYPSVFRRLMKVDQEHSTCIDVFSSLSFSSLLLSRLLIIIKWQGHWRRSYIWLQLLLIVLVSSFSLRRLRRRRRRRRLSCFLLFLQGNSIGLVWLTNHNSIYSDVFLLEFGYLYLCADIRIDKRHLNQTLHCAVICYFQTMSAFRLVSVDSSSCFVSFYP